MDRMDRTPNLHIFDQTRAKDAAEHGVTAYDYKELARIDQRLEDMQREAQPRRFAARRSDEDSDEERDSEVEDDSETSDDIMSPDDQAALTRLALRGLSGLLLSAVVVAVVAWLWSHHNDAKQVAAQWSSRFVLSATVPEEKPRPAAEPAAAEPAAPAATKVVAET